MELALADLLPDPSPPGLSVRGPSVAARFESDPGGTARSLALAGRRFESWDDICQAVAGATAYWNAHRHPFLWGHRRRHRPRRQPGIAILPKAA